MSNNRNRNRRPQRPETPILPAMAEQMHEEVERRMVNMATSISTVDEHNEKTLNGDLEVVQDILDGRYTPRVSITHVEATIKTSIAWLMERIDQKEDLEYLAVMLDIFVEEVRSGETVVEVGRAN